MSTVPELHICIIWQNVINKSKGIIEDMRESFDIRKIYEIEWTQDKFIKNIQRFYGPTLPDPVKKAEICGTGPFLLILFYDNNPKYGKRGTSIGKQIVNTNVYDKKKGYRRILGGKFPIHGSIHTKEANHDCLLLLGKNISDIQKNIPKKWDGEIEYYKSDLIGADSWKNAEDFFYVLNSLFDYIVLRNFENFPEEIYSSMHKDIDILTNDNIQIPYVINQQIPKQNEDFKSTYVKIKNEKVHVDLRKINEGYYDEKWCNNILKNRIFHKGGFYTPDHENYFYSLLYHGLIHKNNISTDYIERLIKLSKNISINLKEEDFENGNAKNVLNQFMNSNKYKFTNSKSYKITHNEITRLSKVAKHTAKNDGIGTLMRAIKGKIRRRIGEK